MPGFTGKPLVRVLTNQVPGVYHHFILRKSNYFSALSGETSVENAYEPLKSGWPKSLFFKSIF